MEPVQLLAVNCDALKLVTGPQAGRVAVREPAKGRVYGRSPRLMLHNRRSCPRFPPPVRIPRCGRPERNDACPVQAFENPVYRSQMQGAKFNTV